MTEQSPPDDRDAWLDGVRRWYYGGTPPAGDRERDPSPRRGPREGGSATEPPGGDRAPLAGARR